MKATTSKSKVRVADNLFSLEALPIACLLVSACILAILGGSATSALFFGTLLTFSLLLAVISPKHPARQLKK